MKTTFAKAFLVSSKSTLSENILETSSRPMWLTNLRNLLSMGLGIPEKKPRLARAIPTMLATGGGEGKYC
jgi:hypothetical protein